MLSWKKPHTKPKKNTAMSITPLKTQPPDKSPRSFERTVEDQCKVIAFLHPACEQVEDLFHRSPYRMAWFKIVWNTSKPFCLWNVYVFHCKVWPRFLTSCLQQSFSLCPIKWGFKKSCPVTCACNADPFWRNSGSVTGFLMRNGQEDSVLYCRETQGAQQALLFLLSGGKQKKLHADERKADVFTNHWMGAGVGV